MELVADEAKIGAVVFDILSEINAKIYAGTAPSGTTFPYAVFTLRSINQSFGAISNLILSVNIWDNKGNDIAALLNFQKSIIEGVNRLVYADDDTSLRFYLESINNVPTDRLHLRRREITFNIKYIRRV